MVTDRSDAHQAWSATLTAMESAYGVSSALLASVLTRVRIGSATGQGVARVDIANGTMLIRKSQLSAGSVTKATEALIDRELIREAGEVGGRRSGPVVPLQLGHTKFVIGIHVGHENGQVRQLDGVLTRLSGEEITWSRQPVQIASDLGNSERELVGAVTKIVEDLLRSDAARRAGATHDGLIGVGIEIGAHVWRDEVIVAANARDLDRLELGPRLTKDLGRPVVVENDVNARVIDAYYENRLDSLDVVLVEVFDGGVGGAQILDGRLYRGSGGLAPEPGHLAVEYPPLPVAPSTDLTADHRPDRHPSFADPCTCSTPDRPRYGHVDTLATPCRISGELAHRNLGDITAAAAKRALLPGPDDTFRLSTEGLVFRRAGTALGRGLAALINIVNPGQLVLRLPSVLAAAASQTSGAEYLSAVEDAVNEAFSTGPTDARNRQQRLRVESVDDSAVPRDGALAAATTVLNAFIEHARERDGCTINHPKARGRNRQDAAA